MLAGTPQCHATQLHIIIIIIIVWVEEQALSSDQQQWIVSHMGLFRWDTARHCNAPLPLNNNDHSNSGQRSPLHNSSGKGAVLQKSKRGEVDSPRSSGANIASRASNSSLWSGLLNIKERPSLNSPPIPRSVRLKVQTIDCVRCSLPVNLPGVARHAGPHLHLPRSQHTRRRLTRSPFSNCPV